MGNFFDEGGNKLNEEKKSPVIWVVLIVIFLVIGGTLVVFAKKVLNRENVTVTFDGNIFVTDSETMSFYGLTINYDYKTSYLTINGTPTDNLVLGRLSGLDFALGDKYATNLTYISGYVNYPKLGRYGTFVVDVSNLVSDVQARNWIDVYFANSNNKNEGEELIINSEAASTGNEFTYWMWFETPSDWVFKDYTVKIDVTKVETETLQQGQTYGIMPTPKRTGYTFDGWYTGENGTGTRITSDTVMNSTSDHTLYAKWIKK